MSSFPQLIQFWSKCLKIFDLWAQLFVDFILLAWLDFIDFTWFHWLYPILLTSQIFMEISQTINCIVSYHLIIKTRQLNLTNIISSNSMQFTLNSFQVMSHYFCIKQSTKKFFMSYAFNNIFIDPCILLTSLLSTAIKEHIFDFNATNSLSFLWIHFPFINNFLTGSKNFESCG